jgi:histone H3/H4
MSDNKVEDLSLPNAVVTRIIKEALPPGTIVGKVSSEVNYNL